MRIAVISLLALSGLALGGGAPPLKEPLGFDHGAHQGIAASVGLDCMFCHPAGPGTTPDRGRCHDCHQHLVKQAPKSAPGACTTCHVGGPDLKPASHTLGWEEEHGPDALSRKAQCKTCHVVATCLDCHESRGAVSRNPHGPGWRSFHGVDARRDPDSCASCHAGTTCTTCHEGGRWPW